MVARSLTNLSLCSGLAGLEIGLKAVIPIRTICYVENELSAAAVLVKRMEEGHLDEAVIWSDLRTFDSEPFRHRVDIVTAGFPCQPFSVAGQKLQDKDPRNMWPETARHIRRIGSPVVFLENVPGIIEYYFDTIRPELRAMGYEVTEGLFSASEAGAPHRRKRFFILAYTNAQGLQRDGLAWKTEHIERPSTIPLYPPSPSEQQEWTRLLSVLPEVEPTFCRTLDGTPDGVELRLRGLGNAVVPAVSATAFKTLSERIERY